MAEETKNKTILIVEDEEPVRNALLDKFANAGFGVLTASDGEEGFITAAKEHPDLMILDIIMPKIDGMSLLKKVRAERWGKEVPIIMLTNLSDPDSVSEAARYQVFDFLVKTDWRLDEIVNLVKQRLNL